MAYNIKHNGMFYNDSTLGNKKRSKSSGYKKTLRDQGRDRKDILIKQKINELIFHINSPIKNKQRNKDKTRNHNGTPQYDSVNKRMKSARYDIAFLLGKTSEKRMSKIQSMRSMTRDSSIVMSNKQQEEISQSMVSRIRELSVDINQIGSSMNNNNNNNNNSSKYNSICNTPHSEYRTSKPMIKRHNSSSMTSNPQLKPPQSRNIVTLNHQWTNISKLNIPIPNMSHRTYNNNTLSNFRKTKSVYKL